MSFVIALIPEAAMISGLLSEYKNYNDKGEIYRYSTEWLVDHENNAILASVDRLGGPYEGTPYTYIFILFWNEQKIGIQAKPSATTFPPSGPEITWLVHRIRLPNTTLLTQKDQLLELIKDGLRVFGRLFNGYEFSTVHTQIDWPSLEPYLLPVRDNMWRA